jgi:hypothetical protein
MPLPATNSAQWLGAGCGACSLVGTPYRGDVPAQMFEVGAVQKTSSAHSQSFPYPSKTTLKPPLNLPRPLAGAAPALA